MLTGDEIINYVNKGDIFISNFNRDKVNPNSYNLTLNNTLKVYDLGPNEYLDIKQPPKTKALTIPEDGLVLYPGFLYLGSTNEKTACNDLIPCIDGRSSIGRLGIFTHVTAGFGDIGFHGKWTLEITVVHPVKIYPNMEICQIYFYKPDGETKIQYHGKYQYQDEATESKISNEF